MRHAVVCVGDGGISGLATVRSLGRRGVPVHVVALAGSAQIASASRYCRSHAEASDLASLPEALRGFPAGALLYVDNDPMLEALAPHAGELAQRFALVDPLADAPKLTDKAYQMRIAQKAGIAIPRSWFPRSWEDLLSLKSPKRLIAKPVAGRVDFKALIAASAAELAAALAASFSGEHYWINLHADLLNLSHLPRRAPAARRPYLGRKEWAVFAADDPAPWRKSLRALGAWLFRRRSFGRALERLAARRA